MTEPTFVGPREALKARRALPDHLFRTLCDIWDLCWNAEKSKVEWLGPTSIAGLADRLGMSRVTMWRTLGELRKGTWVDVLQLRGHALKIRPRVSRVNSDAPSFIMFPLEEGRDREDIDQVIGETSFIGEHPAELSTGTSTAEALEILLKGVGVGQPARSRIIATGISIEKAGQHLARKRIAKEPLAYAIKRMLDGLPVPEYCQVCLGIDGQHKWVQDATGPMECPVPRTKHWSAVEIADAYGDNFGEITPLAR